MVADVKPITHLSAVAIDRQRFARNRICDHQGQKLLWKLIRTVIIGTVGGNRRKSITMDVSAYKVIRGSFGSGVGTVGRVSGGLFERRSLRVKRAIDLVGRDMNKTKVPA